MWFRCSKLKAIHPTSWLTEEEIKAARKCSMYELVRNTDDLRHFCVANDFFPANANIAGRALLVYFVNRSMPFLQNPDKVPNGNFRTGVANHFVTAKGKLDCVGKTLGKEWDQCAYIFATLMIQALNEYDGCKFE